MKLSIQSSKQDQQGVAIIEALIAILIFSIGVLGIVGMQANMLKNTTDSQYRAEASYIAEQMIGTMWSDMVPVSNLANNYVGLSNIAELPGGQLNIAQLNQIRDTNGLLLGGRFAITIGWTAPGELPAANAAAAPCFMTVAHCFTTITSIVGG